MRATPRRTFLHLLLCVAMARGLALGAVWSQGRRRQRMALEYVEVVLDAERIEAQLRILLAWFRRCRHGRRYTHREWQFMLEHGERWGLSASAVARAFGVSVAAACRQKKRWLEHGRGVREPPEPTTPNRRIADSRRCLAIDMVHDGFQHNLTISRHLALQGEKVSPRSIGRFRREAGLPPASLFPVPRRKAPRIEGRRTLRPALKESAEMAEAAAPHAIGPRWDPKPRTSRLIRTLADAFAEGIGVDKMWLLDEEQGEGAFTARIAEAKLYRSRISEERDLVHQHLRRIPPENRHRFRSTERAAILGAKYTYRLSHKATARWFFVHKDTLSIWLRDVDEPTRPDRSLVEPLPSVEAAVADILALLPPVPKRLQPTVRETIAALADKVPLRKKRKGRLRKRNRRAATRKATSTTSSIEPLRPNHFWSSDITPITLDQRFQLLAIIDLYSRDILAWNLFDAAPSSDDLLRLFRDAVSQHGAPETFLTDQGGQFKDDEVAAVLHELGVDHREGAVGEKGSIAIIERLWRSAKEHLDLDTVRPHVLDILRQRMAVVVDYYRKRRPHTALKNATPAETYAGVRSRALDALPAPRGRRGEPCPPLPVRIRHAFDDERKLPYLERVV